jgi:hypothetical protein
MSGFDYNCPHCGKELSGSYGDDVYCDVCDITYETDYTDGYDDENEWADGYLTGVEHKGKKP